MEYEHRSKCLAYMRKHKIKDLKDWRNKMLEIKRPYKFGLDAEKDPEFILLSQCKPYVGENTGFGFFRSNTPSPPKPKPKKTRKREPSPRSSSPNSIEYPYLRRCPRGRRRSKITHKCVKKPKI